MTTAAAGEGIRLDTHRVFGILLAAFRRGPELVAEERTEAPGKVLYRWSDGQDWAFLWLDADDVEAQETLRLIRRDPAMAVRARALLARAFELHGREDGFHLERVAELLHGRRDQLRSHRERQLRPLQRLVGLFERGHFHLVARQPPPAPDNGRRQRRGPDRRAAYYGTVQGPLLRVSRRNRRTATVWLSEELRQVLEAGPYTVAPAEAFRLDDPHHRNPRGTLPSRADRANMRLGALSYERQRRSGARGGRVQAVRFTDLLRFSGIDAERIEARRRTSAFLDVVQADLRELGRLCDVGLAEPVRVQGKAADCLLRLTSSRAGMRRARTAHRAAAGEERRGLAGVTATGSASSTGPPSGSRRAELRAHR